MFGIDDMLLAAGLQAGSSALQGLWGSDAADKAAKQQQAAIREAQGLSQQGTDAAVQGIGDQQGFWDKGYAAQNGAFDEAKGYLTGAQDGYTPYAKQGGNAFKMYSDAIGANGRDAQSGFYKDFQTDPGFEASQNAGLQAVQRSAVARGNGFSGGTQKALYDYGQKNMQGAFNDRLGQLWQGGQTGYSATGQQGQWGNALAGLAQNRGNMAQGYYGASATIPVAQGAARQQGFGQQADYAIGRGNAAAQGTVNSANAWGNAFTGMGNAAGGYFGYKSGRGNGGQPAASDWRSSNYDW